ncbi:MAG: carbohydrate porin [Acidobacteria bacterium]|nr:carbohydrate porin [Acidobacteriota bacterium]
MRARSIIIWGLVASLVGFSSYSMAEDAATETTTVEQRLAELEQKIKVLERLRELEAEKTKEKAKDAPTFGVGKDGFFLRSADGSFQMKFRGLYQTDGRFFTGAPAVTDTLLLRRIRPIVEGSLAGRFDFKVVPDFGDGKVVLQDAIIGLRISRAFNVQAGKFKEPFGVERLQSGANLLFVERALPNNLVPNRDIGVQFSGDLSGGVVSYAAGAFNGVADGGSADSDSNSEKDIVARLFTRPFKSSSSAHLKGVAFGVAMTIGEQAGALPSFKTPGQQTFFSYSTGTVADGDHFRVSPQVYYGWGALGLLAEFVSSSQDVRRGETRANVRNSAWQLAGSYVLTGEVASYSGVTPAHSLAPREGHWGAVEVVLRYSDLRLDEDVFTRGFADGTKSARRIRAWAMGLNWYLSKNVKVVGDYERSTFRGGSSSGDRDPEGVILSRLQVAF